MIPFIPPPPAVTNSGWCNEKHCEACTWADCEHDCHAALVAEHVPECNPGCDETGHLLLGGSA